MGQGEPSRHKVFLRFRRSFLVQDLQDTRFELRHIRDVIGDDSVLSRRSWDYDRVNRGTVVDFLVRQTEIERDSARGGSGVTEASCRCAADDGKGTAAQHDYN